MTNEVTFTETFTVSERNVTDEERHLAHKYNNLVEICLDWATKQMKFGTHDTRVTLTKSVLTSASRLAALDTKTQTEQHRVAFQSLLQDMSRIDAAATPALAQSAIYQDKDGGD